MLKNRNKINELRDLLDSDDELPATYNEEPDMPAYLDDHRFDNVIEFNWIKNSKTRSIPVKQDIVSVSIHHSLENNQNKNSTATKQNSGEGKLIKKGILNEQDILCLRCVAARACDDSALLWFIDFLMYKDLQSSYKFLKSCLALNHDNYDNSRTLYLL